MAKIQCKMCGGTLDLQEGVLSGTCNYCGNVVTFPKISDEQYENLYNRAEHFRRINEYDKAVAAYEKIVEINSDDAEAYWGLVLSRYGIEYVEDPVSHERIPTCHRVQYDSILADADYLAALEHAGSYEKGLYEAEAKRISEIQKGILAISSQEEPFDVFICYKESDDMGRRTRDSVVAQEIYYELTEAGYKVFFARITLESKIGQQYEPYIFAALNSAKAMLVIGSKKEFFEAVWVKNEWSRYLALLKKDRKKLLIPCYRDMDAYDIPEELSMFQAQDMSKIGFIQDILHGIKKVASKQTKTEVAANTQSATAVVQGKNNPLLRRAKISIENGDFESALTSCDKVLDNEPENSWAYFYKFLAENNYNDEDTFYNIANFQNNKSIKIALRFADDELKEKINSGIQLFEEEQKRIAEDNQRIKEETKRIQEESKKAITESLERIKLLQEYEKTCKILNFGNEILAKIQQRIQEERNFCINIDFKLNEVENHKQATQNFLSSLGDINDLEKRVRKKALCKKLIIIGSILALIIGIFVSVRVYIFNASYYYKIAEKYYYFGDYSKAVKYYRKAADKNHADSKKQLESEEISLYILATEKNDAKAQCDLGKYYLKQEYDTNAILWLKKSADQGYAEAQYNLGACYDNGDGVTQDYTEAVKWYRKAAEQGHIEAQFELGICYHVGNGVKQDYAEAVKWYRKAAEQGMKEAQYALGLCYHYGIGVSQNKTEAVKWWRKSAEQGDNNAKAKLESEEISLYILATEKNDAKAQCDLGEYYLQQLDDTNAILWLKKSAEQGYAEAQYDLGKYYLKKEDYDKAIDYLKKASSSNHEQSKELLRIYYEKIIENQGIRLSSDYETLVKCDNQNITECVIPDGVTTIGEKAFWECKNLQSVIIPDSVMEIGNWAFAGCFNLQSITIPASVTKIGESAFCMLVNVNIASTNPYFYKDLEGALISKKDQKLIWFPANYYGNYAIPDKVKIIGERAFFGCKNLQSVTIGNSVTTIRNSAFAGCRNLQSVTIPDSVTKIDDRAFNYCNKLKEVRVPKNCKIGKYAFPSGCKVIKY